MSLSTSTQNLSLSSTDSNPIYSVTSSRFSPIIVQSNRGELICSNIQCQTSMDPTARTLYETITEVYRFFKETFGLHGIDGHGEIVPLKIHLAENNAFWSCEGQYCSWTFNNLLAFQKEIVTHEYTHGIIARLCPLNYFGQPGALNESCADVMGFLFRQSLAARDGQNFNDWTIGSRLADRRIHRNISVHIDFNSFKALNRQEPTQANDYGYIHENSKIPSHAFFQAVTLMEKTDSTNCYKRIGKIWFKAMLSMSFNETFRQFAIKTIQVAKTLKDEVAVNMIVEAWVHVKILKRVPVLPESTVLSKLFSVLKNTLFTF